MFLTTPRPKRSVLGGLLDRPLFLAHPTKPRTVVYVDGFNLYYGAVKGTSWKWLDLAKLFGMIRPADDIQSIRYFTAMVNGPTKPNQEIYLRAIATTPLVEVILGNFKRKRVQCKVAACTYAGKKLFETQEEKRTDVNIAIYMLDDAYQDKCDKFVLVSGDSDLVPAARMIRHRFPEKQIIVYVPAQHPARSHAVELRSSAHINRNLPLNLLKHCQFADPLPDLAGGFLRKPALW